VHCLHIILHFIPLLLLLRANSWSMCQIPSSEVETPCISRFVSVSRPPKPSTNKIPPTHSLKFKPIGLGLFSWLVLKITHTPLWPTKTFFLSLVLHSSPPLSNESILLLLGNICRTLSILALMEKLVPCYT